MIIRESGSPDGRIQESHENYFPPLDAEKLWNVCLVKFFRSAGWFEIVVAVCGQLCLPKRREFYTRHLDMW